MGTERSSARIAATLAALAVVIGILWDISWDASLGRDSFWSPPHLAIYLGGIAAGLSGIAIAVRDRKNIGAWILVWGAVAMQAAAVLDEWWQAAYGFHSGGWSPPQALLTAGIVALHLGAMILTARARVLFALAGGSLVAFAVTLNTEFIWTNLHHTGPFYEVSCALIPIALVASSIAAPKRFGATLAASVSMSIVIALILVLPLFPAKPELGPIYNAIDRFLPPIFPPLLVIPAIAIDLLVEKLRARSWIAAIACGVAFAALFIAVEWNFATFLLSPAADNFFFAGGGKHWPFNMQVGAGGASFWGLTKIPFTAVSAATAIAYAIISARIGVWIGESMRGAQP